jgi:hypothetical protein
MSVIIALIDLNKEQIKLIQDNLTIQPVNKKQEEMKKWPTNKGKFFAPEPATLMFIVSSDKKFIRLPYHFGCCLLGKIFNLDKPHMKVIENKDDHPFMIPLREHQIPHIKESLEYLNTYNTTILGVPPGEGKTIMGTRLWYDCGDAGLFLVPMTILFKSWMTTFSKCVPSLIKYIWVVGENGPPAPGEIPAIILCLDTRINKIPEYIMKAIGTLIIDEAHMLCTPTAVECLLACEPKKIIILTATLERPNSMEHMIYRMVGQHGVFKISTAPYLVIRVFTGVKVEEEFNEKGQFKGSVNSGKLYESLSQSEERNNIIIDIIKSNQHCKFIVLSKRVEHVAILYQNLLEEGITCDTLAGDKSVYYDSRALVGTMPKMGTGFDEENACEDYQGIKSNVEILAHSVKEWQAFEQYRGRVMRSSFPIIIWFEDDHKMCKNHWKGLTSWINETNGTIKDIHYYPGSVILPQIPIILQPLQPIEPLEPLKPIKKSRLSCNNTIKQNTLENVKQNTLEDNLEDILIKMKKYNENKI